MADNIPTLPSPDVTAVPVATDEIGGVHFQRIKVHTGADGVAVGVEDVDGQRFPVGGAQIGLTNETAPASDTAAAGINGRLQRIAQNLTSYLGLTNEAAPANDTAASGINGRLQRIAQRLTSLIALIPASLGQKAMADSLAVTIASDQTRIPTGVAYTTAVQVVANGATDATDAIDVNGYVLVGVQLSSVFDGTIIQLLVSADNISYQPLYDPDGTIISIAAAASRHIAFWAEVQGWRYYKIRCGTAQSTSDTGFIFQLASRRS